MRIDMMFNRLLFRTAGETGENKMDGKTLVRDSLRQAKARFSMSLSLGNRSP